MPLILRKKHTLPLRNSWNDRMSQIAYTGFSNCYMIHKVEHTSPIECDICAREIYPHVLYDQEESPQLRRRRRWEAEKIEWTARLRMGNVSSGQSTLSRAWRNAESGRHETKRSKGSQENSRTFFLLYLIHRAWNGVVDTMDSKGKRWDAIFMEFTD